MMALLRRALLLAASCQIGTCEGSGEIYSVYSYGAVGDGKTNDTAAVQSTLDAAGAGGGGTVWLPHNGTFLFGGGVHLVGHVYDGVTLRVDGAVTVPPPHAAKNWSSPAQCGLST